MIRKKSSTISMEVLRPNAAGIDIGATTNHVALPPNRNQPVREFGSFTCDLHALANWLLDHDVTTVAMESTGVYWIPLFQILEDRGVEVFLVNAYHVKAVPGRKTDVKDCQWLQHLHSVGLLRASFQPQQEIAAIRSLSRNRDVLTKRATQHIHHIQKSLTQMNVQLHHVISDITGITGLAIIDAILAGQFDPLLLAELKDRRIKASKQTIAKALEGDYQPQHLFTLRQAREALRFTERQILECDAEISRTVEAFNKEHRVPLPHKAVRTNSHKKLRLRDARDLSVHAQMYQAFGIDLFELPGFATATVLTVFAEVGPDFDKFRSASAFASWLSLCPDNKITGGRVRSSKTRQTKSRLAASLRQAAYALAGAKSYYGDLYRRLRAKFGAPKAVTAMANRLARLLYHLVTTRQEFNDSKFAAANARYKQHQISGLRKKAQALGFTLQPA
jgi:transposase